MKGGGEVRAVEAERTGKGRREGACGRQKKSTIDVKNVCIKAC